MLESQKLLEALEPMDISSRADKIRGFLPSGIDGIVISHLKNVRYATGFTGSNALVYLTRESLVFITDGRYTIQSSDQLERAGVVAKIHISTQGDSPMDILKQYFKEGSVIGLEADTISWANANAYIEKFSGVEFTTTSNIVESARLIKEKGEVDRIRAACRIADDALEQTLPMLKSFPTEKQFATALDRKMVDLGASGNSFDTITACGTRAALPHAYPTDAKIESNQMIVIDFGCMVDGYCSDMTRTVSVGQPDEKQSEMYAQVIESQRLGREFVKAGVKISDIDAKCRDYLTSQGVGQYFAHSTGHGVGIDIHEQPWVRALSEDKAQAGHILTVEPGIYIENAGGVRIEDTLHVTEDGHEVLTSFPKDLVIN